MENSFDCLRSQNTTPKGRLSRRTKEAAEAYLDIMSKQLAKDENDRPDPNDDSSDIDDISVSGLKSLRGLRFSSKSLNIFLFFFTKFSF